MVRLLCPSEVLRCYIPCAYRYSYPHVEGGFLVADRLSPAAFKNGNIPGVLSNSRQLDSGPEGARGPRPPFLGGRPCAALGDSSSQSEWPRSCSADPGPSQGSLMISRVTSGSPSRTFTWVVSRKPDTRPPSLDPAVDRSMSKSRGGKSEISGPLTGTRCSRRAALQSPKCTCPSSLIAFRIWLPPRGTRTRPASA